MTNPEPPAGADDGRGVWLAHTPDWSVIVPFGSELKCLRFAVERQLLIKRASYGENLLEATEAAKLTPLARPRRSRKAREPVPPVPVPDSVSALADEMGRREGSDTRAGLTEPCPECVAGKHANCPGRVPLDGNAGDDRLEWVTCPCAADRHGSDNADEDEGPQMIGPDDITPANSILEDLATGGRREDIGR